MWEADFDPGAGTNNLTSQGLDDVFIQKLAGIDYGNSITLDASGNVYTTGYFYGTADFDPGAGTNNLTSQGSTFELEGLYDEGVSITLDPSDGYFIGTADFDPGAGTNNLTSQGLKNFQENQQMLHLRVREQEQTTLILMAQHVIPTHG